MSKQVYASHNGPQPNRWTLTPERMAHLNACAAQGKFLKAAADELGVRPETIKTAALREGKQDWLRGKFPKRGRQGEGGGGIKRDAELPSKVDGEMRWYKAEDLKEPVPVPENVQAKWLTRRWAA